MLKQHAGKGEDLSMNKAKIAVLVSGGGTNLQALLDAQAAGALAHGEITLVVSSNEGAYALTRAANAGIRAQTISPKQCGGQAAFEAALSALLAECEIDLIVLAGFLTILSADFTARWPSRILNVHPSLIPAFCGKGMYGLKVHEAALRTGVKVRRCILSMRSRTADASCCKRRWRSCRMTRRKHSSAGSWSRRNGSSCRERQSWSRNKS